MREKPITPAELARLISSASNIVALTGAGLSTAAGIPDFRGPNGAYRTVKNAERIFDLSWFKRTPQLFYEFAKTLLTQINAAQPTACHKFLAEIENTGKLTAIVTQNIDLLHQASGSKQVIELHGSFGSASCLSCGDSFNNISSAWWADELKKGTLPRCRCGGIIKPGIVFFGEDVQGFHRADKLISECDLLLILGTSLSVAPASLLPRSTSAPIVVIGKGRVEMRYCAHYRINGDLDETMLSVREHLASKQSQT